MSFALAFAIAINLGMILVPILLCASVTMSIQSGFGDNSLLQQNAVPLYSVALLWMSLALFVACVVPRHLNCGAGHDDAEQIHQGSATEKLSVAGTQSDARREVTRLAWGAAFERACMVSGVENGTAMLLETEFGWPYRSVGLGLMVVGLGTIVVCCLGAAAKFDGHGSGVNMLLSASVAAILSVVPLFDMMQAGPPAIFTADMFIYSATFLMQGICDGAAVNAANKGMHGYSLEDYQVGKVFSINLGRAVGSGCSRLVLASLGRNAYASEQLILGLLGCGIAYRVALLMRHARDNDAIATIPLHNAF